MENITLPKFKNYKVGNDPSVSSFFKIQLDSTFFSEDGGYSSFYDGDIDNVKKNFQNLLESLTRSVGSLSNITKLDSVFDFLEKKEGKSNPIKGVENMQSNTLYPVKSMDGKSYVAMGWKDEEAGDINLVVLPSSLKGFEDFGEDIGFITDIKDGGVFVWGDSEFEDDEVF